MPLNISKYTPKKKMSFFRKLKRLYLLHKRRVKQQYKKLEEQKKVEQESDVTENEQQRQSEKQEEKHPILKGILKFILKLILWCIPVWICLVNLDEYKTPNGGLSVMFLSLCIISDYYGNEKWHRENLLKHNDDYIVKEYLQCIGYSASIWNPLFKFFVLILLENQLFWVYILLIFLLFDFFRYCERRYISTDIKLNKILKKLDIHTFL